VNPEIFLIFEGNNKEIKAGIVLGINVPDKCQLGHLVKIRVGEVKKQP
jgi:hypothetical protein